MKSKNFILVTLYLAVLTPIFGLFLHSFSGVFINYAKVQTFYNLTLFILSIKYVIKVKDQTSIILLLSIFLLFLMNIIGASVLSQSIINGLITSMRLFSRYYFFIYFGIICAVIFRAELNKLISWIEFSSIFISIMNIIYFLDLAYLRILFPYIRSYQNSFATGGFSQNLFNVTNTGIDFRFYGYFFDTYAQYLFPLAGLVLLLQNPLKNHRIDSWYYIKFILLTTSIIISTVKTAWLQLVIILLLYIAFNLNKKKTYRLLLYTSVPLALFLSINYEIIFVVINSLLSGRDFSPMTYGIFEGIPAIVVNDPFLTIFGGNIDYQYLNASYYNYLEAMEVFFIRLIQYCGLGALIIYLSPLFSTRIWRKDVFSRFTLLLLLCVLFSGVHYEVMVTAANLLLSSMAFTMFIICKGNYSMKV